MRILVGFVLVLVSGAAIAGGAGAKAPPEGIGICGSSGCKAIAAADAERIVVVALSGSDSEPAAPGPSYLLRWKWPNQPERRAWWLPRGGLVRGLDGGWISQSVTSEQALQTAVAGVRPYPLPSITRAIAGGRVAENPRSYLRLLVGGRAASADAFDRARGWIPVGLTSLEASPWTNGSTILMVSRAGNWVWRDAWIYAISPGLAERARHGRSLVPFARAG